MINKLKLYGNMLPKILRKEVVNNLDYRASYNDAASTYGCWLEKMGGFTDNIIKPHYMPPKKTVKILDFACGTGYISRKLIEMGIPCEITVVDLSEKMLEACADLSQRGVKLVHMDGLDFLESTDETFDMIYCGWALPYFQHKVLLKNFMKVLNTGGIVGVIANSKGTLSKMEEIFLSVMEEDVENVKKPMDIRFNLPNGQEGLRKWFEGQGFSTLEIDEGEAVFSFNRPEQLLEWLNKTGALAGTMMIFDSYERAKPNLIKEITKQKLQQDQYVINHKFVYGIFRYGGENCEYK
ncbi:Methyltransferase domain-containing protein [Natronincola peptidivorans]|uniref:Methyltransferase domain-containing protein n=1 Tax=Natronincola peptidivorans TaxID=426128 RepID=A0A1I0GXA4_9FIRM|nr:class I SAM-dependent methyltransferase [Natronincola peptidivorans]SET76033.1 Methyltransferase domain-containing protein [Natronincola peptidivorans]